jgi:parallel beta helix pectate lyase-like protein
MKRAFGWIGGLALFAGIVFQAGMAHAQATRTWVSGVGDDVNPCSRTAPCKTFAGAISKTAAGGIINCLDPGGFGAVTITKAITIDCSGTFGGVLGSFTNAINVNAASGDTVTLRGLSIEGGGTGLIGVNFLGGGVLHIENCKIHGFNAGTASGIYFASSTGGRLIVSQTSLNDNGAGGGGGGILVRPGGAGGAKVVLRNVEASGNSNGIAVDATAGSGGARVQVVDSTVSGNSNIGVYSTGNNALVFMDRVSSLHNGAQGVLVNGVGAAVVIGNSTISDNGSAGVSLINGGVAYSYVNNNINANIGPDGTPLSSGLGQY